MKRMKYVLAMVATLALLVSCSDKLVPEVEPEGPAKNVVFTATTESAGATKTVLDGNDTDGYDVLWRDGDAITIVDAAATPNVGVYTTNSTTTTGSFTLSEGAAAVTSPFTAYYPATIYNSGTPTLPAEQTYVAGNIAGAPMLAVSDNNTLGFKNLTGIIRLNLTTSQTGIKVSSIALSATQGMSGAFNVTSDAAVISSGTAGVTLNCPGEGVTLGSTPTPFYIAVPANTYTGLSITVTATSGASQTFTLKSSSEIIVARSQITDINLTANNIGVIYDLTPGDVTVPAAEVANVIGSNSNSVLTIGEGARVILKDATLKQIVVSGNATLVLSGTNTQTTEFNGAAISIADNKTLTIEGTGRLNVDRKWSADYGCIHGPNANLVVNGGTMVLESNKKDGGNNVCVAVYVKNYTQTGGSVEAYGKNTNTDANAYANGIQTVNDVIISGGNLFAIGGTGIWVGNNITISGGTVRAEGNERCYDGATGIVPGGNNNSPRGKLTITGGTVTAIGGGGAGGQGPGIGRRTDACGDIIISGGNVTVTTTGGAAAIGTGTNATNVGCNVTITSSIERLVTTKGESAQEVIGRGNASSSIGTVVIDGITSPGASTLFPNLNVEVTNSGNTWTFTPRSEPLVMVGTLADLKDLINAGNDCRVYLGRYVYSDGSIGTDETEAIGIVAYMATAGSAVTSVDASCRILVIGLEDMTNVNCNEAWGTLNAKPVAIEGVSWTNWRVPTTTQWIGICCTGGLAQGNFANLCGAESQANLSQSLVYWTSTIHHNDAYDMGWPYTIQYSADTNDDSNHITKVAWNWASSDNKRNVRAIFGY